MIGVLRANFQYFANMLIYMFLSPADLFFKINFFEKLFQEYHQSSNSLIYFRPDVLSGMIRFKLFAKVISRRHYKGKSFNKALPEFKDHIIQGPELQCLLKVKEALS